MMFAGFFASQSIAQPTDKELSSWAYDSIHISLSKPSSYKRDPVIIAVVDDAFRLSHNELKDFVYMNPGEIPGNQLDDDGNNYIDDVHGWDISDNDNDVSILEGRDKVFYHGTYISSIITKVAYLHYGEAADLKIKIMPVKVISDQANRTYVKDGYKGIRYAIDNGADIICLAWSGGNPGNEDLKIIHEAFQKGILIIGSVGNFNEEKIPYPALAPEVIAVAGIDMNFRKEEHSNYSMNVDIAAPAKFVMGAHPEKDNAYIHDDGTSAATALVVGCAAVIMSKKEGLKNSHVKEALLNTSTPFTRHISTYGGKMGTGIVNLKNALDYISNQSDRERYYSSLRSKGSIMIDAESTCREWEINPAGGYQGFYLEPDISCIKKPEKHSFSIVVNDTVWNKYNLSNSPSQVFVPSSSLKVDVQHNSFKKNDVFRIFYHGKTTDSTELYCSDIRYLNLEKGSIDDGSGENNYANLCSCKWIITVPDGKRIKFIFDQMDTQPNVDFVYLVDGQTAIPENFIAKFSGQNIPPVVISRTNEVLVWFVTDKFSTGQGWQFHYKAVE
jgi:hypothetical protein